MNQTLTFSEDDMMQHIEAGNKFLQDHLTLEGAWIVYSGAKRLLAMARSMRSIL